MVRLALSLKSSVIEGEPHVERALENMISLRNTE